MTKKWEASMRDLWWAILARWRMVLCVTVCCTLIFGLAGVCVKRQAARDTALTEAESAEVEELYQAYQTYLDNQAAIEASYLTQMDAGNVYYTTLRYYISQVDSSENASEALWQYYTELENNFSLTQCIADTKENLSASDAATLLTWTADTDMVTLTVAGGSEEDTASFVEALENRMEEIQANLSENLCPHTLTLIEIYSYTGEDASITNALAAKLYNQSQSYDNFEDRVEALRTAEIDALEARLGLSLGITSTVDASSLSLGVYSLAVYLVIGFLFGLVVAFLCGILSYVNSRKVKNADEVASLLDAYTTKPIGNELQMDYLCARVACDLPEGEKVLLVTDEATYGSQAAKTLVITCMEKLEKLTVQTELCESPLTDIGALSAVQDASYVVLTAVMGQSSMEELRKRAAYCREKGCTVIGVMLLA